MTSQLPPSSWDGFLPSHAIVMIKKNQGMPSAEPAEASQSLSQLAQSMQDCSRCKLSQQGRHTIVFGEGNSSASLLFVGEGPGEQEDMSGRPFVGNAGQLLTRMIEAMGLKRDEVYICNVVKCRPPGNRNPEPDEVSSCSPFLREQIRLVQPRVIVALGKFAAETLLQSEVSITKIRGQVRDFQGIALMPTYHPSYLLRNPSAKKEVWEDLKKVAALLEIKIPSHSATVEPVKAVLEADQTHS